MGKEIIMKQIKYIIIHCTATAEFRDFKAKDVDAWHKQKGWDGIGYHYLIDIDGTVEKGRPENKVGAHCKGYNDCSIGVCYVGGLAFDNKTPKDTRTYSQKDSLLRLLKELKAKYPGAIIVGHRDMPNVYKACPCFNAKVEYKNL